MTSGRTNERARRILVAGASGVIGRRLVPILVRAGHRVTGTSRREDGLDLIRSMGATAVRIDVLDPAATRNVMLSVAPEAIINQLTDLSGGFAPDVAPRTVAANARIREIGTRNLADGARAAGTSRMVSQSIAWLYAAGDGPHLEDDPLRPAGDDPAGTSVRGVLALEQATLRTPGVVGTVLRYGSFYGPGAGEPIPGAPKVHVDAAAMAAVLAAASDASGVFNVAEAGGGVSIERALSELRWDPRWRTEASAVASTRPEQG